MRARYPDVEGFVEADGLKIGYEVYGDGSRTVVFPPIDPIVHSRAWKAQIPYLSRYARVVTIDPRGNGRSDRSEDPEMYRDSRFMGDILAVMDAVGVEQAVLVGLCTSSWFSLLAAAEHPDRVLGVASLATWAPYLTLPVPWRRQARWGEPREDDQGWAKDNKYYWLKDYRGYAEFFFGELLPEAHSTKQFEDCVEWAMESSVPAQIAAKQGPLAVAVAEDTVAVLARVTCPVLTMHGTDDRCQPLARSELVAELTGGRFVALRGAGHLPQARCPVVVNRYLREFLDETCPLQASERPLRGNRASRAARSPDEASPTII
jgi:pimeloyl-ACP methyl ester carboxylesterase